MYLKNVNKTGNKCLTLKVVRISTAQVAGMKYLLCTVLQKMKFCSSPHLLSIPIPLITLPAKQK